MCVNIVEGAIHDHQPVGEHTMLSSISKPLSLFLLAVGILVGPRLSNAQSTYEIDAEHSFVTFKVNRFGLVNVVGFFPDIAGHVVLDPSAPLTTTADITIQTSTVYMGKSANRDGAVKGPVFLDVANFPEMTFKMTGVENDGFKNEAVGQLTIHGTTNEIRLPYEIKGPAKDPTGLTTIAISGHVVIDRRDYGLGFNRTLGSGLPFIGNDVDIEINVLAVQSE